MLGFQKLALQTLPITVILWLATAGWFYSRYQTAQQVSDNSRPYAALVEGIRQETSYRFVIFMLGKRAGTDEMKVIPHADGSASVTNKLDASLSAFGRNINCVMDFNLEISSTHELDTFDARLQLEGLATFLIQGKLTHKDDDTPIIELAMGVEGSSPTKTSLPAPKGFSISDSFLLVMHSGPPKPGNKWSTQTIDPITRRISRIDFTVLDKDELPGTEGRMFAFPINAQIEERSYRTFINEKGEVLWQEAPYGITLVREDIALLPYFRFPGQ